MPNKGDEVLKNMAPLLKKLENSEPLYQNESLKWHTGRRREERKFWLSEDAAGKLTSRIPLAGIYVFYEKGKPKYVGRSNKNRLQRRIGEHSHPKGRNSSATWAYKRAKNRVPKANPDFAEVYAKERREVREMQVRVVEVTDDKEQYFFEAYVAATYEIPSFQWETH